ncbi:hypothetical protein GCM10010448_11230 [Streptomyces glomeratus]|uniref:Uncharacterized protein n=1 Tax=Streptomyces glomeratus TaxID=284452 RepID=A0ABP6L7J3_9ACTN
MKPSRDMDIIRTIFLMAAPGYDADHPDCTSIAQRRRAEREAAPGDSHPGTQPPAVPDVPEDDSPLGNETSTRRFLRRPSSEELSAIG